MQDRADAKSVKVLAKWATGLSASCMITSLVGLET